MEHQVHPLNRQHDHQVRSESHSELLTVEQLASRLAEKPTEELELGHEYGSFFRYSGPAGGGYGVLGYLLGTEAEEGTGALKSYLKARLQANAGSPRPDVRRVTDQPTQQVLGQIDEAMAIE